MEISSPQKRFTVDFSLKEVVSIGGDLGGKYLLLRMVPNERTWERSEVHEVKGYLNRFDDVFISDEELANVADIMDGVSISHSFKMLRAKKSILKIVGNESCVHGIEGCRRIGKKTTQANRHIC